MLAYWAISRPNHPWCTINQLLKVCLHIINIQSTRHPQDTKIHHAAAMLLLGAPRTSSTPGQFCQSRSLLIAASQSKNQSLTDCHLVHSSRWRLMAWRITKDAMSQKLRVSCQLSNWTKAWIRTHPRTWSWAIRWTRSGLTVATMRARDIQIKTIKLPIAMCCLQ